MIQVAICSFLVGAVFGLRFKVMVLLPFTVIGALAVAAGGLLLSQTVGSVLFGMLTFAVALQVGYMFGSFTRFVLVALRASRALPIRTQVKASR